MARWTWFFARGLTCLVRIRVHKRDAPKSCMVCWNRERTENCSLRRVDDVSSLEIAPWSRKEPSWRARRQDLAQSALTVSGLKTFVRRWTYLIHSVVWLWTWTFDLWGRLQEGGGRQLMLRSDLDNDEGLTFTLMLLSPESVSSSETTLCQSAHEHWVTVPQTYSVEMKDLSVQCSPTTILNLTLIKTESIFAVGAAFRKHVDH